MIELDPVLSSLSLDDKIAQMIMVDFSGKEMDHDMEVYFGQYNWGGVILFSKNLSDFDQTKKLISDLQVTALAGRTKAPLLVGIDQEGGFVTQMPFARAISPGNMAVAATRNSEFAYESAALMAKELRSLGINMDFAPVVDINTNPGNPVIGVRSFSDNIELAVQMAEKSVKGFQESGVAACAKHFPGHGDTELDSHLSLPTVRKTAEYLENADLKPFVSAIHSRVESVMTAHVFYPAIDREKIPATFSPVIMTDILRGKLGFKGLLITDSLNMKAISDNYGYDETTFRAVSAGADILLACGGDDIHQGIYFGLKKNVEEGKISVSRIDESVKRILRQKFRRPLSDIPFRDDPAPVMKKIALNSITLLKNDNGVLPIKPSADNVLGIICPGIPGSQEPTLGEVMGRHSEFVKEINFDPSSDSINVDEIMLKARECNVVLMATFSRGKLPEMQVNIVRELQLEGKPFAVASIFNPYDIMQFDKIPAYIVSYGFRPVSLEALAEVVLGKFAPKGKLPVTIPGLFEYGRGLTFPPLS
ncbi:MAG: beta-N-acetylhexosaminidase [Firmicutes bacterium]|nr:beta-N-acetylhexosaminidase [Bacillota bacterium]